MNPYKADKLTYKENTVPSRHDRRSAGHPRCADRCELSASQKAKHRDRVRVYIESSDEHTDAFLSYLTSTSTGFTFRHYESLKDMKDDVASGRIDSAYMVPDGFVNQLSTLWEAPHNRVYNRWKLISVCVRRIRVCRPPVCICGRHVCMYAPGPLSGKCPIRRDPGVRIHQ